ncbi:MAG: hypothetical protein J6N45_00125 [Alphaproteobacteria bacterium]|nr:hypothetical protein [Alphaproteobacteria bacterium]
MWLQSAQNEVNAKQDKERQQALLQKLVDGRFVRTICIVSIGIIIYRIRFVLAEYGNENGKNT